MLSFIGRAVRMPQVHPVLPQRHLMLMQRRGQNTAQVHATSPFTVGMWVLIDEASAAQYVTDGGGISTQVWADVNAFTSGYPTKATGRVIWKKHNPSASGDDFSPSTYPYTAQSTGCYLGFCDRPTSEIHHISAIEPGPCPGVNCRLTFDSPLTIAYRQSGSHNALVYVPTPNNAGVQPSIQNAGVENMTIELERPSNTSRTICRSRLVSDSITRWLADWRCAPPAVRRTTLVALRSAEMASNTPRQL